MLPRREEVEDLAPTSVDYYTRLEQAGGRDIGPDSGRAGSGAAALQTAVPVTDMAYGVVARDPWPRHGSAATSPAGGPWKDRFEGGVRSTGTWPIPGNLGRASPWHVGPAPARRTRRSGCLSAPIYTVGLAQRWLVGLLTCTYEAARDVVSKDDTRIDPRCDHRLDAGGASSIESSE
ncbi:hypothetical protein SCA03_35250 [Streptomyces cacaoi]|uniref:Uncharacterized protein n=1 Tax=Streptomyces cacaoi TaxID=1898 RepID=A0A4Y3QZZ9_STRCI|nr:hypothetical protein SCA03_35250 [Streptomyces cacaoi]